MRAHYSNTSDDLGLEKPYWSYDDIGVFFLILVLVGSLLRLLVRCHLLSQSAINNPSAPLQFVLITSLSLALYLVLRLRHHRPVLRPLGWICPGPVYFAVGMIVGGLLASGVMLYVHLHNHSTSQPASIELLLLAFFLGPILEESFFRGCLLPLIAQATGNVLTVLITALLFALFHQPADLAHCVSFTVTGVAYGWIRVVSRSTVTATLMHTTYNLALWLSAPS